MKDLLATMCYNSKTIAVFTLDWPLIEKTTSINNRDKVVSLNYLNDFFLHGYQV